MVVIGDGQNDGKDLIIPFTFNYIANDIRKGTRIKNTQRKEL